MLFGHALVPHGLDDQRRRRAPLGPCVARLVDVVVDPCERPGVAGMRGDRVDLPMGGAGGDAPVEGQVGQVPGQLQQMGEIVVGRLLPAGRPDELEALGEPPQVGAAGAGYVVHDPVDGVQPPGRAVRKWRIAGRKPVGFAEAEQADHPVHVEIEQGFPRERCIHRHMRRARRRNLCRGPVLGVSITQPGRVLSASADPRQVQRVRGRELEQRARRPRRDAAPSTSSLSLDDRTTRTPARAWLRLRHEPRLPVEAQGRHGGARRGHPPPAAQRRPACSPRSGGRSASRSPWAPGSCTSPRSRWLRSRWCRQSSPAASSSSPCSRTAGSASSSASASGWASR